MGKKTCIKCRTTKPRTEFYKHLTSADGFRGQCKTCVKEKAKSTYRQNPEAVKASARQWYADNKQRKIKNARKWYEDNREECIRKAVANTNNLRLENPQVLRQRSAKWYKSNRDTKLARNKQWKKRNTSRLSMYAAKRRAALLQAAPDWADKGEIAAAYEERDRLIAETETNHHVDHIVPLLGLNVCGLHVPWNLQVIPANENLKKGNSHGA